VQTKFEIVVGVALHAILTHARTAQSAADRSLAPASYKSTYSVSPKVVDRSRSIRGLLQFASLRSPFSTRQDLRKTLELALAALSRAKMHLLRPRPAEAPFHNKPSGWLLRYGASGSAWKHGKRKDAFPTSFNIIPLEHRRELSQEGFTIWNVGRRFPRYKNSSTWSTMVDWKESDGKAFLPRFLYESGNSLRIRLSHLPLAWLQIMVGRRAGLTPGPEMLTALTASWFGIASARWCSSRIAYLVATQSKRLTKIPRTPYLP